MKSALGTVVPAINLTQFHILHVPAALFDNTAPHDVFESDLSDESELSEERGVLAGC